MEATVKMDEKTNTRSDQDSSDKTSAPGNPRTVPATFDWDVQEKFVADITAWNSQFPEVRPLCVSEDGEQIASIVQSGEETFTVCQNGKPWNEVFEKAWSLRFDPSGRAVCIVSKDDTWTVAVDGLLWTQRFEYAWNLQTGASNGSIGINTKKDDQYGACLNDKPWDRGFADIRNLFISADGTKSAASVAVQGLAEADIFNFQKGVWTVAVNGIPWDKNFVNVWELAISHDGNHVAAEARINLYDYAIMVDGTMWPETYKCVWEPLFSPASTTVVAPVKLPRGWTLAADGKPVWGTFVEVWNPRFSPDGQTIAAVVAPEFGKWTIAINGSPWRTTFSDTVLAPVFSRDGKRVAAIGKRSRDPMNMGSSLHAIAENDRWTIAVDGIPWEQEFDMIWDPVFSPDGSRVAAKAEINGKYCVVVDGKPGKTMYDALWPPVFSSQGDKVLVRCIRDGKYYRCVVPADRV